VGAYTIDDQTIASYSSRGPTEDGRTKPDVVGPTDVTTTTLGDEAFSGSSAAAPHVAGLAALWVDATEVHDDPAGFAAWQQDEARDAGDAGMDNTYGWGLATGDEAPGCGCSGVDGPGAGGLAAVAVAGFLVRRRGR
jgi:MYXO-CTERM domain-containing protein